MGKVATSILMLSGGKDSCALAVKLVEQGEVFIAVTIDNDLLSDIARENILKLTRALGIEVITYRPDATIYKKFIDAGADMEATCSVCSATSTIFAQMIAGWLVITRIYAGFTKYTAEAQGWDKEVEKVVNGFTLIYPFMAEYDLKDIKATCVKYGLEFDPTKTNCKYIKTLIDRSVDNPFTRELDIAFKDGGVTQEEYDYYKKFTEPTPKT